MHRRTLLKTMLLAATAGTAWSRALGATHGGTPMAGTPAADVKGLLRVRWELETLTRADGTTLTPATPANHTIQLLDDGRILVQADCNSGSGHYTLDGSSLSFRGLVTSLVACLEPTGDEFAAALTIVTGYRIDTDASDRLTLTARDGAILTFMPGLTGVVWQFTRFQSGKGTEVVADDPSKYTLEFIDDDQVLVRADCNRGKGTATIDGTSIDLQVALTRAACPPGSLSTEYVGYLHEAVSWVIRDGQLHLALPVDAGIATFRPVVPSAPDAATPAG